MNDDKDGDGASRPLGRQKALLSDSRQHVMMMERDRTSECGGRWRRCLDGGGAMV